MKKIHQNNFDQFKPLQTHLDRDSRQKITVTFVSHSDKVT